MPLILARITSGNDDPNITLETVPALFIDGYGFGDRLLEGVPFKITAADDEYGIAAEMLLAESIRRHLRINKAEAESDAVDYALQRDVFATTQSLADDDGVILRTDAPASEQSFYCYGSITLDGKSVVLPEKS